MGKVKEHYMELIEQLTSLAEHYGDLGLVFHDVENRLDLSNTLIENIKEIENNAFAIWQNTSMGRNHLVEILQSFLDKDSKISLEQLLTSSNGQDRKLGELLNKLKEVNVREH